MNEVKKKNKRLCETLKQLNAIKIGQDVITKEKHVKVKSKAKKKTQNTFSMINFYQSIPSIYQQKKINFFFLFKI